MNDCLVTEGSGSVTGSTIYGSWSVSSNESTVTATFPSVDEQPSTLPTVVCYGDTYTEVNYLLYVAADNPVAEIEGYLGNEDHRIKIQFNKKLTWLKRLCYNILGFKYRNL